MDVKDVRFVSGAAKWEQLPADHLPEVAFIGRSNVGKSSLINMLLGRRQVARTSRTPGKTQEFNFYLVNDSLFIVDLPGFGYARISQVERARWAQLIGRYVTERPPLKAVFHLVDIRHEPTALDREVMDMMKGSAVPYLVVLTKADKLSGNGRAQSKARVERALAGLGMEVPIILTSAEDKRGREEVWHWIDDLAT